jgi:hypothetical protein
MTKDHTQLAIDNGAIVTGYAPKYIYQSEDSLNATIEAAIKQAFDEAGYNTLKKGAERYQFVRDELAEFKPAGWNGCKANRFDLDVIYCDQNNGDLTYLDELIDLMVMAKKIGEHWPTLNQSNWYKYYSDGELAKKSKQSAIKIRQAIDTAIGEEK